MNNSRSLVVTSSAQVLASPRITGPGRLTRDLPVPRGNERDVTRVDDRDATACEGDTRDVAIDIHRPDRSFENALRHEVSPTNLHSKNRGRMRELQAAALKDPPKTDGAARTMTEEIHRIDKEVAELKGTILVEIRHLGHDIKNMMQAMGAFVPRPEVERMLADARARIDDIKKELLEKVEALDVKQDKRHDGAEADRKTIRNILFSSIAMGAVSWGFWFLKH